MRDGLVVTRGRTWIRGYRGSERVRGPGGRGTTGAALSGLDHYAVDARFQYRVSGQSGARIRRVQPHRQRESRFLGEDHADRWKVVGRFKGSELVGWLYRRPID